MYFVYILSSYYSNYQHFLNTIHVCTKEQKPYRYVHQTNTHRSHSSILHRHNLPKYYYSLHFIRERYSLERNKYCVGQNYLQILCQVKYICKYYVSYTLSQSSNPRQRSVLYNVMLTPQALFFALFALLWLFLLSF